MKSLQPPLCMRHPRLCRTAHLLLRIYGPGPRLSLLECLSSRGHPCKPLTPSVLICAVRFAVCPPTCSVSHLSPPRFTFSMEARVLPLAEVSWRYCNSNSPELKCLSCTNYYGVTVFGCSAARACIWFAKPNNLNRLDEVVLRSRINIMIIQ